MTNWDTRTPTGIEGINKVGQCIRETKDAIEVAFSEEHYFPEGTHKFPSESLSLPNPNKIGRWRFNPADEYMTMQRDSGTVWENLTTPASLFPSGVKMLFCQTTPPAGWTRLATYDDRVLRVVNTTGGTTGGAWGITLSSTTTAHTHAIDSVDSSWTNNSPHHDGYRITNVDEGGGAQFKALRTGGIAVHSWTHSHNPSDSNPFTHSHTVVNTWRPAYKDVIAAERD